ncbi:hypothetical protein J3E72DRAFT_311579 [Bipolaris maydis]|nr:hypothetical protein J3E74DRAFT_324681 [Bipolaris maydis]KAJ6199071.1 hypothetical protein J3E72DRAFT_311579 [Bipolaris maydis]
MLWFLVVLCLLRVLRLLLCLVRACLLRLLNDVFLFPVLVYRMFFRFFVFNRRLRLFVCILQILISLCLRFLDFWRLLWFWNYLLLRLLGSWYWLLWLLDSWYLLRGRPKSWYLPR